jgi:serine protease Do
VKAIGFIALITLSASVAAQQAPSSPNGPAIIQQAKAATVVVLAGEGAGRLQSIATGVLISKDGVILTALHAIKGAAEVQVRAANGDVFDRVELLGIDERRDVAALKISAGALPALTPGDAGKLVQGDPVFAVLMRTA